MRADRAEDGAKHAEAPSWQTTEHSTGPHDQPSYQDNEQYGSRQHADILAVVSRTDRVLAASDLRDEIRQSAPAALAALGVDRPDLRWAAARAYIRNARTEAIERIDVGLLRLALLDKINANWRRRGAPGFAPDESDVADAQLAFRRLFREPPPSLESPRSPYIGRVSEDGLLRLARDQVAFEAAIDARRSEAAA